MLLCTAGEGEVAGVLLCTATPGRQGGVGRVRDWGGGGGAGGLGEVDGGALEGGVWHHVGVVETDHLGVVGWSLWFDAPALLRRHLHILARIRPTQGRSSPLPCQGSTPPSHGDAPTPLPAT